MDIAGLIIAIIAVVVAICLNSKLNKINAASSSKISELKEENEKLKSTVNVQQDIIEQQKRDLNNISDRLSVLSATTENNFEDLNAGFKSNEEAIEKLQEENQGLKEIIDKQNQDIRTLSNAIKNYTDISEDSLRLNVTDAVQSLDMTEGKASGSKNNTEIQFDDLDLEKQEIYDLMENTNDNIFITGKAGTGKSYLLKYFRQNTSKNALYTAPTGISALNIEGVTLHRAFGFNNLQEDKPLSITKDQKKLLSQIDTIVIDEISMVRVDTFNRINFIFQTVMDNSKAFGGKQVIILGDLFQLPPVAKKGETEYLTDQYGGIYFFNSQAYKFGKFVFRELQNIHRQSEKKFIDILNRARVAKLINEDVVTLNEKYTTDVPARVVQVVAKKDDAYNVNESNLAKVPSALHVYNAEFPDGTEDIKENDFPCSFVLELKEGALVMMIANDLEHDRWVNGTLGIVSKLKDDYVEVTINGIPYSISKKAFSTYKCEYNSETKRLEYKEDKTVIQYPVILAYAITIHKSQGMTYQRIACNLDNCFAPGQAYVALSRCANFDELYLTNKVRIDSFFTDQNLVDFYEEVSG